MNDELDLNDKNKVTVMLVQSLWGVISPNIRMAALSLTGPVWQLLFVLEKEDALDREMIGEAADDFSGLLLGLNAGSPEFDTKIVVSPDPLPLLDHAQWRLVFLRREP